MMDQIVSGSFLCNKAFTVTGRQGSKGLFHLASSLELNPISFAMLYNGLASIRYDSIFQPLAGFRNWPCNRNID